MKKAIRRMQAYSDILDQSILLHEPLAWKYTDEAGPVQSNLAIRKTLKHRAVMIDMQHDRHDSTIIPGIEFHLDGNTMSLECAVSLAHWILDQDAEE